jgi:hypothetical protein
MDVVEQVEQRFREELFRQVDLPGPSPRARLFAVLQHAFRLVKTMPILQFLSGGDFDLLYRRVPPETFQEHIASDRAFITELIARCRNTGIPIQAQPEEIIGLLYPLVVALLHEGDYGAFRLEGGVDAFLELVAAFCVGEVQLQQSGENLPSSRLSSEEGHLS